MLEVYTIAAIAFGAAAGLPVGLSAMIRARTEYKIAMRLLDRGETPQLRPYLGLVALYPKLGEKE